MARGKKDSDSKSGQDSAMNPGTKKGAHAEHTKEADEKLAKAIERNVTGQGGTGKQ